MARLALFRQTFLLLIAAGLIIPGNAYCYIDPGTGSFMLQILVGIIIGAIVTLKVYWAKTKIFLSGLFSSKKKTGKDGD